MKNGSSRLNKTDEFIFAVRSYCELRSHVLQQSPMRIILLPIKPKGPHYINPKVEKSNRSQDIVTVTVKNPFQVPKFKRMKPWRASMLMDSSSPFSSSSSLSVTGDVADFGKRHRRFRNGIGGICFGGWRWNFGNRWEGRGLGAGSNQTGKMEAMEVKDGGQRIKRRWEGVLSKNSRVGLIAYFIHLILSSIHLDETRFG